MALIQCPECKKDVSDKAIACPHCGFPIESMDNTPELGQYECKIGEKICNLSPVITIAYEKSASFSSLDIVEQVRMINRGSNAIQSVCHMSNLAAATLSEAIMRTKEVPDEFDPSLYPDPPISRGANNPSILRCPQCGSTAITTGARGANWTWGLIGASKTVNRCGNCGHTWSPGK